MKRISLVAALLGAVVLAFAGVAMAADVTTPGNSSIGGANGNGTQVFHYTADYTDNFGTVHCIGVHQLKRNQPTQDSFTCASTNGIALNTTPGATISTVPGGTWVSDYDGKVAKTFLGTVSADGMSYTAVATY
jgi:hypothetical protein